MRSLPFRMLTTLTAAVCLVAGACTSKNDPAPPSAAPKDGVMIAIDAWSWASLAGTPPRVFVDGEQVAVSFKPATIRDLGAILASDPDGMTGLMARLVTTDPTLACDPTDGCSTADKELPLTLLSDPESVPGLGAIYKAHGFESAVMVGIAEGSDQALVELAASASEADRTAFGIIEGDSSGPVVVASAAFGRFFRPAPTFLVSPDAPVFVPSTAPGLSDPQLLGTRASGQSLLSKGLSSRAGVDVSLLSESQLTFWSSPSTGCYIGVLCSPDQSAASVTVDNVDVSVVCTDLTEGDEPVPLAMVVRSETWTLNPDKPFHQWGVWAGQVPPNPEHPMLFPDPPLVNDRVEVKVRTAELWAAPAVEGSAPRLFDQFGFVAEVGADSDELVNRPWDVAQAIELGSVTPCPEGAVPSDVTLTEEQLDQQPDNTPGGPHTLDPSTAESIGAALGLGVTDPAAGGSGAPAGTGMVIGDDGESGGFTRQQEGFRDPDEPDGPLRDDELP